LPMSMPIEARGGMVVYMGYFSGCCGVILADYPSGGSSRSIPLADVTSLRALCAESAILALSK
jgi:hypothetical protein